MKALEKKIALTVGGSLEEVGWVVFESYCEGVCLNISCNKVQEKTNFCKHCGSKVGLNRDKYNGILYELFTAFQAGLNVYEKSRTMANKRISSKISKRKRSKS